MIARNGNIQLPPDPYGVSGGGLFRLGTFDDIKNNAPTPTLVGIAIENHKTCLIAINIAYALELIRANHQELDIPQSTYLSIDVTKGENK
jgi:hypothetical protein